MVVNDTDAIWICVNVVNGKDCTMTISRFIA